MLTIHYNGYPYPTNKDTSNGNVYKSDIRISEDRHCKTVTVLRRFEGSEYSAIGWRLLESGKEIELPLWIKNKLELK